VWVTVPSGTVQKVEVQSKDGQTFCAPLPLGASGRYMVEVIGKSQRGPEVAALLPVSVGETTPMAEREVEGEDPSSPDALAAVLLARANALRKKFGSPPLAESRPLSRVAQAYSERMTKENFFAHIAPDGEDFTQRLDKADISYERAGENLGAGPSALSAHAALERSPGHRKNLLEPDFTHIGIGYSQSPTGSANGTLVELYARHPSTGFQNADLYRTIDQKRASAGRAPFEKAAALEAVALEEAKRLSRLGSTEVADGPMHQAIAAADKSVQSAKIELFVVGTPRALPATEAMIGADYNSIGAAAARRASGPSGGKWWVVVIFATRPAR
jgi:uncharacterized protein YkwD